MVPRTLTALVGLPILLGAVWAGSSWLTTLIAAAALLGWWEYHRLFSTSDKAVIFAFGALWTLLLAISGYFTSRWPDSDFPLLTYAVLGGGLIAVLPWLLWSRADTLLARARLAVGPIYIGFLLAHVLALRELGNGSDPGRDWLLFALLATFATDTGAFFIGRAVGRHAMAPTISPGKTWEGAMGGLLSAAAAGAALGALLDLSIVHTTSIAVAVGVMGQLGDLAESRLKRAAGAKDTGGLLPGHGGILDRLDSIVFTMPVVYYLVALVVNP